jgi:bifunctional UDP-N-acetylglucosamine pyrophosphorylase / glucosamine-1-phosphate N-acetyltransferase
VTDSLSEQETGHKPGALDSLRAQLETRLAECARHEAAGVTIVDAATTYLEPGLQIGSGTVIEPNTTIRGETSIGRDCRIGPNTVISGSRIAGRCVVFASVVEDSTLEDGVDVGPYSHLRGGTHVEAGVHLGNFVEVKASRIGRGTKAGHFSYIGDAEIGADVNIGAGTITCNYDGTAKRKTIVEDGAFIGSDTMLVAPVRIGRGATTGAGSVVTTDVAAGQQVAGVPARPLDGGSKKRGGNG